MTLSVSVMGLLISIKDFSLITPITNYLLVIAIVFSTAAFVIFFVLTELIRRFSYGINKVRESYLSRATGLYIIEGSLGVRSLDLKSLTIRRLGVLFNFLIIFVSDKAELNGALKYFLANHFIRPDHKDELKS